MQEKEDDVSPQMSAQAIEDYKREDAKIQGDTAWVWDVGIDNITDLLRYLDASGVSVQEFLQFNLYKKNVDKVGWLKELEQHA